MTTTPSPDTQQTIVARAGRYYRNTRYILFIMLLGYGLWSIRDGFFKWPKDNQDFIEKQKQEAIAKGQDPVKVVDTTKVPHPGYDIPFNRALGILLPPLSILFLIRMLYNSRGAYRLEGNTLHVPGHPPVPFENITALDKRLWDRKGIAYIDYDLGNGQQGRIKLDDFVYERPPTDAIYDRIERFVSPAEKTKDAGEEEADDKSQ